MTKNLYLVYSTDAWHSHSSDEVIAVCSVGTDEVVRIINKYCKKENLPSLDKDDMNNLNSISQTQGRDDNFRIESITLNKLL